MLGLPMTLTRHHSPAGPRWAVDGYYLPAEFTLGGWLQLSAETMTGALVPGDEPAQDPLLPPIEDDQEVWASGVTYLRSRNERQAESTVADVYAKVYEADRPEIFFKANGWRVSGTGQPIRIRRDSNWNVPEPELTLVMNAAGEIVGYTAGNDVSSRQIEGENPLYLPQAKCYNGSCALGSGIVLATADELTELEISLVIEREAQVVFTGNTRISEMKRKLPELAEYLYQELDFPRGAFLMTGTGIVPAHPFTLLPNDVVTISVGESTLTNPVNP
jgi:2-dehydro-3-deoxy-D-arabinonate dehydratase